MVLCPGSTEGSLASIKAAVVFRDSAVPSRAAARQSLRSHSCPPGRDRWGTGATCPLTWEISRSSRQLRPGPTERAGTEAGDLPPALPPVSRVVWTSPSSS